MDDKVFVDGLMIKPPHEKAPDFVKCAVSFKVDEIVAFLQSHEKNGWVNADIKVGKSGKWYAVLDTWEPKKKEAKKEPDPDFGADDSIPF